MSKRVIWDFENADFEQLRDNLKNENWNFIDDMDINESTDTFTEKLMNNARLSIPNKECTIRFDDPPWMHNEIRKQIRKRKRLHKIAKRRNTSGDWFSFRRQRNRVTNLIRTSKNSYNMKLASNLSSDTNKSSKSWWNL